MKSLLLRREKNNVFEQLPQVQQMTIPLGMHPNQQDYHASYASNLCQILSKKYKTPYDFQRIMMLMTNMRMVCNSTYLIDKKTNYSSKLIELEDILKEKLDLQNNDRKVIIFSEWVTTQYLIGQLLQKLDIGYTRLHGKIPVAKRGDIIKEFGENIKCQVLLSTEAGGSGLNLQMADTVINFELPWNPAKKNQRIGRIDRLGQKHQKLTVINLLVSQSIEENIFTGLGLKQNLFDGVLDESNKIDEVNFLEKGRSQFLKQLEELVENFEQYASHTKEELIEEIESEHTGITPEQLKTDDSPEPISDVEKPEPLSKPDAEKMEEMEQVMNKGLEFLAGLYQMSTGNKMNSENQKVEFDKDTGEVIMRFKFG
ncbi:MAG: C-terminal helicase domain-containing protein [Saprospiraceae bacterium]